MKFGGMLSLAIKQILSIIGLAHELQNNVDTKWLAAGYRRGTEGTEKSELRKIVGWVKQSATQQSYENVGLLSEKQATFLNPTCTTTQFKVFGANPIQFSICLNISMISFRPLILIIGTSIGLLPLLSNWCVQAQNQSQKIELKVYSENEQKQSCPDKVIVTEKPRPYQEGSFATDGSINLSAYASNISVQGSNSFSVTWVGTLKPKYARCFASAGMTKVDGQDYSGKINYLRMHFVKGKVYFILDLAGGSDANDYPLVVLKNSLKNGNPNWTWGGTD